MFRTSLTGKQGHFLCAIPVRVYVDDEFQPLMLKVIQTELGNFNGCLLTGCQDITCLCVQFDRSVLYLLHLTSCYHGNTSSRSPISPCGHSDTCLLYTSPSPR